MGRIPEGTPLSPTDLGFDHDDIERFMGPYIPALDGEAYDPRVVVPVVHVPVQIPGVAVEPENTTMVMARAASPEALAAAKQRAIVEFGIPSEGPQAQTSTNT